MMRCGVVVFSIKMWRLKVRTREAFRAFFFSQQTEYVVF